MDTPWLTGGPQAPAACAGDIPLGVDGLSLGCWVCWVWSWWCGWELSATVWAHPLLPGPGEGPLLVAGTGRGLGAQGVTALLCSPCISHRSVPDLLLERGTEVEMPSLAGGCCALLMVPVPSLCRSGAAVPSSSCSDGKHPQILQMASGQEL